jgi:hypothetical protein
MGSVEGNWKKKEAGGDQHGAGKQKAGTEDEGDAVLCALKADESYCRENKGKQAGDDLEIALKGGVGFERDWANPQGKQEYGKERDHVPEGRGRVVATGFERGFAHSFGTSWPGRALLPN